MRSVISILSEKGYKLYISLLMDSFMAEIRKFSVKPRVFFSELEFNSLIMLLLIFLKLRPNPINLFFHNSIGPLISHNELIKLIAMSFAKI